jgi:hypothetical protein
LGSVTKKFDHDAATAISLAFDDRVEGIAPLRQVIQRAGWVDDADLQSFREWDEFDVRRRESAIGEDFLPIGQGKILEEHCGIRVLGGAGHAKAVDACHGLT